MKKHIEAERLTGTLLRSAEKSLLSFFVKILPLRITPDHLTTIGLAGSLMIALGYFLCNYNIAYLWLANAGFLINWFGDSLDGSLARYRKIERPLYGFFIDHNVDSISMLLIALGLGLSPYMRFDIALYTLIGYFMLSISTYINAYVRGIFRISYAKIGPTEVRVVAIIGNTVLFFLGHNPILNVFSVRIAYLDLLGVVVGTAFIIGFFIFYFKDLHEMAKIDPVKTPKNSKSSKKA
ncbi:MAG: CDP-alcohol phosphatidyltransferase family protein [Spirochaetales bacterium]|nr:CDP-alcohol phosphatidyltransferase family protein [Spirochaetales bacterium]